MPVCYTRPIGYILEVAIIVVVQMSKRLTARPAHQPMSEVTVRQFKDASDVFGWLSLRQDVFAEQPSPPRPWGQKDFEREILLKPWWDPRHLWLAETTTVERPIGTVILATRGRQRQPVVHWLMVQSAWRRCGIGRLLMSHLEQTCWDRGWHQIALETATEWTAALSFYRSLGYQQQHES